MFSGLLFIKLKKKGIIFLKQIYEGFFFFISFEKKTTFKNRKQRDPERLIYWINNYSIRFLST